MEMHLEEFLAKNWSHTELGKDYDIFEEDGECVGQQYETDTGPIDILAIGKDKKTLLVVELKKGRASDAVLARYRAIWATSKTARRERADRSRRYYRPRGRPTLPQGAFGNSQCGISPVPSQL